MRQVKKHILSNFASEDILLNKNIGLILGRNSEKISVSDKFNNNDPTILTETVESSDQDSFVMLEVESNKLLQSKVINNLEKMLKKEPTYITHSIESSDPDEFTVAEHLHIISECAVSNVFEHNSGPTNLTYTIEATDEDEFIFI